MATNNKSALRTLRMLIIIATRQATQNVSSCKRLGGDCDGKGDGEKNGKKKK